MNKQKRRHFHAKTTSAKLYFYIGVGSRALFIDKAHTVLGNWAYSRYFFLHAAYSALRHFLGHTLNCLLLMSTKNDTFFLKNVIFYIFYSFFDLGFKHRNKSKVLLGFFEHPLAGYSTLKMHGMKHSATVFLIL